MVRVAAVLMGVVVLAGCWQPAWHSDAPRVAPADFALVFTVESDEVDAEDPLRMPSHYVLESDRTLRVALGPGAGEMTYPPPTATLSPAQVEEVYGIVRRRGLDKAPPGRATGPVTYRIAVTAQGRHRRYATTPEASEGVRALLRRLVELRGGSPGLPPQRDGL